MKGQDLCQPREGPTAFVLDGEVVAVAAELGEQGGRTYWRLADDRTVALAPHGEAEVVRFSAWRWTQDQRQAELAAAGSASERDAIRFRHDIEQFGAE